MGSGLDSKHERGRVGLSGIASRYQRNHRLVRPVRRVQTLQGPGLTLLPSELPPELVPLSWLIGVWEGTGKFQPLDQEPQDIVQQAVFSFDGRDVLTYSSRVLLVVAPDEDPVVLAAESGFWRPRPNSSVEAVIADDRGVAALWLGIVEVLGIDQATITGARARLAADQLVRGPSAPDVQGGHRLYGLVEGKLMWVLEQAHGDGEFTPVLSAELVRVDGGS